MNEYGQIALAVNVESCSYADGILLKAHRRLRVSLEQWKHGPIHQITLDNPHHDGSGALADEGDSSSASDDTRTPRQCAAATGQLRPRRGRGCGVGGGPTVAVTPRHEGPCVCVFPAGIS